MLDPQRSGDYRLTCGGLRETSVKPQLLGQCWDEICPLGKLSWSGVCADHSPQRRAAASDLFLIRSQQTDQSHGRPWPHAMNSAGLCGGGHGIGARGQDPVLHGSLSLPHRRLRPPLGEQADGRSGWMPTIQGYWRLSSHTNTVGAIAVRCVRGSLRENIAALVRRCSPAAERVSASRPGIVGER